jgi:hypothetical protein
MPRRDESAHSVVRLMRAQQREEDVAVLPCQTAQCQHLAANGERAGLHAELQAFAGHQSVHLDRPGEQHVCRIDGLLGEHAVGTVLDDAGLLAGDLASVCPRNRS